MILKYIYTVFLGVLLATFVGVGIAAFYPALKYPETGYPRMVVPVTEPIDKRLDATESARQRAESLETEKTHKVFQEMSQTYSRNVSIISLTFAIVILLVSLTLVKNLAYIADGVLLGGVLTLLYSIVRGFESQDNMFRFVVVSIGLAIALVLGYLKFIKPSQEKSTNKT